MFLSKPSMRLLLILTLSLVLFLPETPYASAANMGSSNEVTQTLRPGDCTKSSQACDDTTPEIEVTVDALAGQHGWYRSAVQVTTKATGKTSDIGQIKIRVDTGKWQPARAFTITEDGIHHLDFRTRDKAGNQATWEEEFKIDQHDPIGQFVSPFGGSQVRGNVTILGTVHDETSGMGRMELSLNEGKTWQAVAIRADGTWCVPWDTLQHPDGMHFIEARFTDQAGNTSSAMVYYIVANHPPKIDLTERWFLWKKGQLAIIPGDLPLMDVTINISDPQGRWPEVHRNYSPHHFPEEIIWDGRFGQIFAPVGEYDVTIKVIDLSAQQIEAHGVIVIPPLCKSIANHRWSTGVWMHQPNCSQPY